MGRIKPSAEKKTKKKAILNREEKAVRRITEELSSPGYIKDFFQGDAWKVRWVVCGLTTLNFMVYIQC